MKNRQNNKTLTRPKPALKPLARLAAPVMALLLCSSASPILADNNEEHHRRAPDLPSPACDSVSVPDGNQVSFHAYALGVQIYRWDGAKWVFVAPEAALFANPCYTGQIGIHYAGPTWESNDGSKVVGSRQAACTPNRGAIPWLRLGAVSTSGHGGFADVTYIQRVNTIGGTAPADAGLFVGDEVRVPYTAEYYFYRASQH